MRYSRAKFWEGYDLRIGEGIERERVEELLEELGRILAASVVSLRVGFCFLLFGAHGEMDWVFGGHDERLLVGWRPKQSFVKLMSSTGWRP